MPIRPFSSGDLHGYLSERLSGVVSQIDGLANEYVLQVSQEDLEAAFIQQAIVDPIDLATDAAEAEPAEVIKVDVSNDFRRGGFGGRKIEVPGTRLRVLVPYVGDQKLWTLRPSSFTMSGCDPIDVRPHEIVFTFQYADDDSESAQLRSRLDRSLSELRRWLDWSTQDVKIHNNKVAGTIRRAIEMKRNRATNALGALKSLNLPIRAREQPPAYAIPMRKKPSPIALPRPTSAKFKPEPAIDQAVYEHILQIMKSVSIAMERTPAAFEHLDEEGLRSHFLVQLNGHYEGQATGETFNFNGKTDVCVKVDGKNAFIAECKFWEGPKGFEAAVSQLLRYLSWRDTKAALLVFNKNANTSAVRDSMHEIMAKRPEFRRVISDAGTGDKRYVFVRTDDEGREITITTMVFDLPISESGPKRGGVRRKKPKS
jgi:hypothetical protein